MKTLVQCDFDGTVTDKDVSFLLLDDFTDGDWRKILKQYQEGRITVGRFNTEAFAMIKADKQTLLGHIENKLEVRSGFRDMVDYCRHRGFRFVIVSNGQDFYIEKILSDIGMEDIEFFSAKSLFQPEGVVVQYIGPDGSPRDSDFKETYVKLFLDEGYRIIYIGNGDSDFLPAQQCHHIFATGNLLANCQQKNIACTPFTDFHDVVSGMESL
jgi:2-hydroxy-3-keto-5-methylthiopentenyl-1-phosphate phosphatase